MPPVDGIVVVVPPAPVAFVSVSVSLSHAACANAAPHATPKLSHIFKPFTLVV
jgi:hypothetical protein